LERRRFMSPTYRVWGVLRRLGVAVLWVINQVTALL